MFHAKPATAGADVLERLHMFMWTPPTEFDLRRLELDALRLEKADPSEAYTVRAAIGAIRWDVEAARKWSEKACVVDGSTITRVNASITFRFLNEVDLSAAYALNAFRNAPLDQTIATHCAAALTFAGRLSEAHEVFMDHHRRAGTTGQMAPDVTSVIRVLDACGSSENQLRAEVRAAMRLLSEEQIRHHKVEYEEVVEPDGGRALAVRIQYYGDIESELRLESKLAHRLVEMPNWNPAALSVEFAYLPTNNNACLAA